MHAKHMYKFRETKPKRLRVILFFVVPLTIAAFIPIGVVEFSQRKAGYPPLLSFDRKKSAD